MKCVICDEEVAYIFQGSSLCRRHFVDLARVAGLKREFEETKRWREQVAAATCKPSRGE